MPEKLEEVMRKIYMLLANCKTSPESREDVLVPKKRLFDLLEQLNYAVYETMEQYEATVASRNRERIRQEKLAKEREKLAVRQAEDIYSASFLYMQDILLDMKNSMEMMCNKVKEEYEELLQNYDERMQYIQENETELKEKMSKMIDSELYLQLVKETREKKEIALQEMLRQQEEKEKAKQAEEEQKQKEQTETKEVESKEKVEEKQPIGDKVVTKQILQPKISVSEAKTSEENTNEIGAKVEEQINEIEPTKAEVEKIEEVDEFTAKLSSEIVVTVHKEPAIPEGFTKPKEKRSGKSKSESEENIEIEIAEEKVSEIPMFDSEQLDREYFESQIEEKEEMKWENSFSKKLKMLVKQKK